MRLKFLTEYRSSDRLACWSGSQIYRAVKPSGTEPQLGEEISGLTAKLRPYQLRAAAWMVSRETIEQVSLPCDYLEQCSRPWAWNMLVGALGTHGVRQPSWGLLILFILYWCAFIAHAKQPSFDSAAIGACSWSVH